MGTKVTQVRLEELVRGLRIILSDKFIDSHFAAIEVELERDPEMRAFEITALGMALGETIGEVSFPEQWERFLKTKRCPKYLKTMKHLKVNVYYPKISLPKESHWVTFDRGASVKIDV